MQHSVGQTGVVDLSRHAKIIRDNQQQTGRLEALVASGPDYAADLGGGWTIAVAFAHLVFWDSRQAELLREWSPGKSLPSSETDDQLNTVLEPFWQRLSGEVTGPLAIEASREFDSLLATIPDSLIDALIDLGETVLVSRAGHRREHLDQIEKVMSRHQ
jgi:hypothetical protein